MKSGYLGATTRHIPVSKIGTAFDVLTRIFTDMGAHSPYRSAYGPCAVFFGVLISITHGYFLLSLNQFLIGQVHYPILYMPPRITPQVCC